jgi:tRNA uridine 5-carboxymethylaminomethyl modification enzyme
MYHRTGKNTKTMISNIIENKCEVAVVGAGHAGIEAALACARLGVDTVLFTLSLDAVANMPCNPSIGGTGKGHLVYEIDALGGEMGAAADKATLQSRTLNLSKGSAVHSKRIQADRTLYKSIMLKTLQKEPKLRLVQAEITGIEIKNGRVCALTTRLGARWEAKAVVLSCGTYLCAEIFVGDVHFPSGPDGQLPSTLLTQSLLDAGVRLMRFKTGTPPRVSRRTVDFSSFEVQNGELDPVPFSSRTKRDYMSSRSALPCYIVYTNEKTHKIIRDNLKRSALFSGKIHGVGARYCPSIEDKIVRFADKERHQIFIEPMGADTDEIYLSGFSTSMPADVQEKMVRSLPGFEHAYITRYAYAIEYDCADPTQLLPTLEFKEIRGLFGAGQFNGTSGYEEAAAQGLIAGINAAAYVLGREPLVLGRSTSYIGILLDDLVTKGTDEPYRIMTSRSEYRLYMRQDNADKRLTEYGHAVGLISDERYAAFKEKQRAIKAEIERLSSVTVPPSDALAKILAAKGSSPVTTGIKLAELLRRPELDYESLAPIDPSRPTLPVGAAKTVETTIKYEGYIKKQIEAVERQRAREGKLLLPDIDYSSIRGLRIEAVQKLSKIRPISIGQAARISGVSPADISVLLIYLESKKGKTQSDIT